MKNKRSLELENIRTQIRMRIIKNLNLYGTCKDIIGYAIYKSKYNEEPKFSAFNILDIDASISNLFIIMSGEFILDKKGYENKLKFVLGIIERIKNKYPLKIESCTKCLEQYQSFISSKDCEIILRNFDKYGFSL